MQISINVTLLGIACGTFSLGSQDVVLMEQCGTFSIIRVLYMSLYYIAYEDSCPKSLILHPQNVKVISNPQTFSYFQC